MTIKEANNAAETDYNGGKSSYAANAEPGAFAWTSQNPLRSPAATSTNTNTGYQPTIVHGDNATGGAVITTTTTAASTTSPPPGGQWATPSPPTANRAVPPNAPPGGQWVRVKYAGNQTWGIIGGTACCLFWFLAMITAPLALTGLLCPCDEKVAYMSPTGVIYDERGQKMGDRRRNKFTVLGKA